MLQCIAVLRGVAVWYWVLQGGMIAVLVPLDVRSPVEVDCGGL